MDSRSKNNSSGISLEEKFANVSSQLSSVTERLGHVEHDLDLERASREDIIKAEVERRLKEMERALEAKYEERENALETDYEERKRKLEQEKKNHEDMCQKKMEKHDEDMKASFANLTQRVIAEAKEQVADARRKAESNSYAKLAQQLELFMKAFLEIMDGNSPEGQALLKQYQEAVKESEASLKEEVKEVLDNAEKKANKKTQHLESLVRMLFLQKSERFVLTDAERETLLETAAKSADLTDDEKAELKACNKKIAEFRQRKRDAKLLRGEKKGHGRKPVPSAMPRLAVISIYPECYYGHEEEYRVVHTGESDLKEVIVPAPAKYFVQPYAFPTIVRKDDLYEKQIRHPRAQGVTWKSPYSEELRAQIVTEKYSFHMPANRQIKRMSMDGLDMSASTMDDIIESTCNTIEPLYDMQWKRAMKAKLLAADGSPMPVLDNEKHKTVKQYVIEYRSIDTGIPVFISTPPLEGIKGVNNGRGKKVIEANLSEWTGQALMCDAYAGYDWVKKSGRILCRCDAHARRKMEAALKENQRLAKIGMTLHQQIYAVEDMIKSEEKSMGREMTPEEKVQFRNDNARPLWNNLKLWCMKEILNLPHESKIFEAMNYLLRHYDELTAYLDIAEMPLDNTDTERSIRDMVMGKKAYLYCRNYEAVDRACIMYSLFGACKVLGKNPERWLTYVLKHIDTTPKEELHKLLPEEWEDA